MKKHILSFLLSLTASINCSFGNGTTAFMNLFPTEIN